MFWVVSLLIIRGSRTVHTASGMCQACLLLLLAVAAAAVVAPDDGQRNCPKHVEHRQ